MIQKMDLLSLEVRGKKIIKRVASILKQDKSLGNMFYLKWGIDANTLYDRLLDQGLHGGLFSKAKSLSNLDLIEAKNILCIGPEIGLEVFLLASLGYFTTVADPDEENLKLVGKILEKIGIDKKKIRLVPMGVGNNLKIMQKEKDQNAIVLNKLGHGLPCVYNITSNLSVFSLKDKFDLIFIHKIILTLTRFSGISTNKMFSDSVGKLVKMLNIFGCLSWTEPKYMVDGSSLIWSKKFNVGVNSYKLPQLNEEFNQVVISLQ